MPTMDKDHLSTVVPRSGAKLELPLGVKLVRTIEGHQDSVRSVAFDPAGQTLASGSFDNTVKLWEWASGKLLRTIEAHQRTVMSVAFDPTGRTLASGSGDRTVKLWDLANGKRLCTLKGRNSSVLSLAFDPTGQTLASGGTDHTVKLWNRVSGTLLRTLKWHKDLVRSVAFDPTGQTLASGSDDKTVKLWEPVSGKLLRTLEGDTGCVLGLAFDPKAQMLATGSSDKTVKLWEAASGKLLRTLEGHTSDVVCVAFLFDGRLMASKSNDGTVRLWRCETWETVAVIPEPTNPGSWIPALAFHPAMPFMATVGKAQGTAQDPQTAIHLWELDLAVLLDKGRAARAKSSLQHRTAKVILVGDTGVGKSGLAHRLVYGKFIDTRSSHARKTFVVDRTTVKAPGGVDEHRETVLWDLAGQPAYRLVHQLAMEDAAVACVLFDARSDTNPLEGAAYWSQALDQARTNTPITTLLVPARMDVGGLPASDDRIRAFAHERGFDGVFPTSALTGDGCDELLMAIRKRICWDDLPAVSSTETLAALREFVAKLKAEKASVGALLTVSELHRCFETDFEKPVPIETFIAYLQRLEDTDAVDVLAFHSIGQEPKPETHVLLDPTRVDAYASALLVAAKDEPDGPGHLLESRVRNGDFKLADSERLANKDAERHLLWFVVESLLARDLALREMIKDQGYVVFPAQCTRELKFPGKGVFGVAYGFAGPVKSIYATLIAQLAHYEGFKKREFFQDAAAYRGDAGGRCLVRLTDHGNGTAELEVSFEDGTPGAVRQGFLEFVARHLETRSKPESVKPRHACHCAKCQNPFEDRVVKLRLAARKKKLICPVCEAETPLLDLLVAPTAASTAVAEQIDANAKAGRQRITAEWVIKAKEAEGKYDVFLSHNSKDKAAVEEIARKLKTVGIRPWLDKWDLKAGKSWVAALQNAIPNIGCAAVFYGPAGSGPWEQEETEAFLVEFVSRGCSVLPVILPDAPQEPDLPVFLKTKTWVNMRDWKEADSDAYHRLVYGILGKPPGDSPSSLSPRHVWEWQKSRRG